MPEGNKTERATPKKRYDERKKGNVFLSNDVVAVATLIAAYAALRVSMGGAVERVSRMFYTCFEDIAQLSTGALAGELPKIIVDGAYTIFIALAPLAATVIITGIGVTFYQTKMLVAWERVKPNFGALNPIKGFQKLFSLHGVVECLKNILKITILLVIIYHFLSGCLSSFVRYMDTDIMVVCRDILSKLGTMILQIILAFTALAGGDAMYQWWEFERQMRMTKQEVKEEYKMTEGDPQVKGKIKEKQRQMSMSRMMQKVPQADVIIRNPTHVAVALRYKPESDNAPVVLAKGIDELALRIVRVGEENGVATVENVPLARSLYAAANMDQEIPPELYGAVADVLVYIYNLNKKK